MTVAAFTDRDQSDSSPLGALQPFIEDPTIEEIWINLPARIFIARNGKSELDRKSTRLNSSHIPLSRMPSSA